MPYTPLLWVIGLFIAGFCFSFALIPIINKRGDQALLGVIDGVPISLKTRRLLLLTHYIPLCSFIASFDLVLGLGLFQLARRLEDPEIAALAYMGAVMGGSGAVVWTGLAATWVYHTLQAIRQAEASRVPSTG